MTDKEAYKIIGERAEELVKLPEVQKKMIAIAREQDRKAAERYVYMLAVATLCK